MLADISRVDAIYIVCGRTDMRKQIDGLCAIIEEKLHMGKDDNALFPWLIIPGLFEPPVRTLRATIPENESHIFR